MDKKKIIELKNKYLFQPVGKVTNEKSINPFFTFFRNFIYIKDNEKVKGNYLWLCDNNIKKIIYYDLDLHKFYDYELDISTDFIYSDYRYITKKHENSTNLLQISKVNNKLTEKNIFTGYNIDFFQYNDGKVALISLNNMTLKHEAVIYDENTELIKKISLDIKEKINIQGLDYPIIFAASINKLYKINIESGLVYSFNLSLLSSSFKLYGRGDYRNGYLALNEETESCVYLFKV